MFHVRQLSNAMLFVDHIFFFMCIVQGSFFVTAFLLLRVLAAVLADHLQTAVCYPRSSASGTSSGHSGKARLLLSVSLAVMFDSVERSFTLSLVCL